MSESFSNISKSISNQPSQEFLISKAGKKLSQSMTLLKCFCEINISHVISYINTPEIQC